MFIPIPNLALASRRARQRLPALTSFMEQWDPATMPTMPCGLCMRFSPWTVHLSGFSSSLSHEFLSNWGYSWLFQDLWSMNHLNQPDHPQFELSIWLSDFGISIVQQRKGPLLVAAASRHTLWTPWRIHLVLRPTSTNIQQFFMMFHSCVSYIAIIYHNNPISKTGQNYVMIEHHVLASRIASQKSSQTSTRPLSATTRSSACPLMKCKLHQF